MALAFVCNFALLSSYYILRPVRDAMATVFGVNQLQNLFTGTLILTLVCSPIFAWLTDTFKLSKVLIGVFGFLIVDLLLFYLWFNVSPGSRFLAAGFYWWFSVVNLFMISVFWSLIVDVFTSTQSSRLVPAITAGGSLGAIAGPVGTSLFVKEIGVKGMLLVAASGFVAVIVLVHYLIQEKRHLQELHAETQSVSLDIALRANDSDWFERLPQSLSAQIERAVYYGHFFCHVFHQDYIVQRDADAETVEHELWQLLDQRGAEYPAEHNVGHVYPAKQSLRQFYRRLDPTNSLNPGLDQTPKRTNWEDAERS